jgi:hypothetical protein
VRAQGRLVSWLSLAVLGVAAGATGLISVVSSAGTLRFPVPPDGTAAAASSLDRAVQADLAGSFVVTMTSFVHRSRPEQAASLLAVYQAPNRSELFQPVPLGVVPRAQPLIIWNGDLMYRPSSLSTPGSMWLVSRVPAGHVPTPPTSNLEALRRTTGVVEQGSTFRIVDVGQVRPNEVAGPGGLPVQPRGVVETESVVTATVSDGHVVEETITSSSPGSWSRTVMRYSRFGSALAIVVPKGAQPVPLCGDVPSPIVEACWRSS